MNRILLSAGLVLSVVPAQATNMSFMPGDAFFHARLTQDVVDAIPVDGSMIILPYSGPDHAIGDLGGYAGFDKLEVRDIPPDVAKGLKAFHSAFHEGYPKRIEITIKADGKVVNRREIDALRLFVTVTDFRPGVHHFGLKYNEDWHDPPPEAKKPDGRQTINIPAAVYQCYVRGEEAIVVDWRDGPKVPPLPVEITPYAAWGLTGAPIEQPAIVNATEVRFFILWGMDMRHYFRKERDMEFWEVTPTGFRAYRYEKKGDLKVVDVPFNDIEGALDGNAENFDE